MKKADLDKEKPWAQVDGVVLTLLGIMILAIIILISTLVQRGAYITP